MPTGAISREQSRRARTAVDARLLSYEPTRGTIRAMAGDGFGGLQVANRPGFYWVRLHGDQDRLAQASGLAPPAYGEFVNVEIDPHGDGNYSIVGEAGGSGRQATVVSFDPDTYTCTVTLEGATLVGIAVAWSVRSDLVVKGALALLLPSDAGYIAVALFGGKPKPDPFGDPEFGHEHDGSGGGGKRIKYKNIEGTP